jgi:hypothetical protein
MGSRQKYSLKHNNEGEESAPKEATYAQAAAIPADVPDSTKASTVPMEAKALSFGAGTHMSAAQICPDRQTQGRC